MLRRTLLVLTLVGASLTGCGTTPFREAQTAFNQGQYDTALELLASDRIRSRDRLLALMESGLILHHTGDYEASSKQFLQLVDELDRTDFISASEQGSALLLNDWTTTYRGEYAERLWVHTYQIMNFLMLNRAESAAVEARQALKLLEEHADVLDADLFSRAAIGLAFEAAGLPNDALIEYRRLSRLLPQPALLAGLLEPLSRRQGLIDEARQFGQLATRHNTSFGKPPAKNHGELILFVASGRIPQKLSGNIIAGSGHRISFPVYAASQHSEPAVELRSNDRTLARHGITTDLGRVIRASLAARAKQIGARQLARVGAKDALVDLAESESESGAAILSALLFILEEADTRAWQSLPSHLTMLRIALPAGTHDLSLQVSTNAGDITLDSITIRPGQRVFRRVRTS